MSAQPELVTPEDVVAQALHPADAPETNDAPWEITDRGAAEWAMQKVRQTHHTFDAETAAARQGIEALQAEIDRLTAFIDGRKSERDSRVAFFESKLTAYLRGLQAQEHAEGVPDRKRTKSLKLAGGTVQSFTGRPRVVIGDEDAFVEKWTGTPLVKVEAKPVKSAVLAHVKAEGEIPDGASVEYGDPTFRVVLDGSE